MKSKLPLLAAIIIPIVLVAVFVYFGTVKSSNSTNQQNQLSDLGTNNKIDESLLPKRSASQSSESTPSAIANESKKADNAKTVSKTYNSPPEMQIDKNMVYTATINTTAGTIVVLLNAKTTPITVNNFVFLAKNNFYDNTIFHRVIKGFMIQAGDPKGNGTGGPGYKVVETPPSDTQYSRGTIAMAKRGDEPAGTSGSQFFIMHKDYSLPPDYIAFGSVTSGLDVVDKIATAATLPGGEGSTPVNPVKIQSVEIIEQ